MKKSVLLLSAAFALAGAVAPAFAEGNTVALVVGVKGSPFYEALACGAKAKAKELGLDLTVSAGDQFAADSQVPIVNAVAAAKPAVAVVVPTDFVALVPPLKQMDTLGTKVVVIDLTISDTSFVKTQILTDNKQGGKEAADAMNKLLGGKGKVLVITQPPGSSGQDDRTLGFEQQLKQYPGLDYVGAQYQSDDPQKAAEIVTSALSAHPDLAGIFATNDQGAIGTITGLKQAGADGKVKLVAYDAATAEVNALKNGQLHTLIAQNPKVEGELAMEAAAKLIKGESLPALTSAETVVIGPGDTASADKYEYKGDCQ